MYKEDLIDETDDDYQNYQGQQSQESINLVQDLYQEIITLKNEVNTLKKISIITIFGSTEKMKQFYNDVW